MHQSTSFCVIYQFKVRPGKESAFMEGWSRMTEAIRDQHGGLGSRLHVAADGWWVAYAQWPDRDTWEAARTSDSSADPEARRMMVEAVEERREPILLEPRIDLLELCRADSGG